MGIYKSTTEFINKKISESSDQDEKRLLSNGFIPEHMKAEYETYIASKNDTSPDADIDKISNGNYFGINKDKVAGTIKPGTGFLNPVLVKGSIEDVVSTINNTLKKELTEIYLTNKEQILEALSELASKSSSQNDFLMKVQTMSANFGIDNTSEEFIEAVGLVRKDPEKNKRTLINFYFKHGVPVKKEKTTTQHRIKTESNVNNIITSALKQEEEWQQKITPMAKKDEKRIFIVRPDTGATTDPQPEINVRKRDLAVIKANNLLEDDVKEKTQTTAETVKKYNSAITESEIKAWVYHKRKFGNPMKGWEKYYIGGGSGTNILLRTTKDTTIKDNKYVDLRTIPADTILGAKTKFHNTYGTDTLVICKTPTGELVWVNTADVKEIKNVTSESQSEIDKLINDKALIFDGNEYYPYPVFLFGNIYEKIAVLNENKEAIVAKYGAAFFDEQLTMVKTYLPKLKSFRDPVKSSRPHILCLSEFANDETQFGLKQLHEETGVKLGSFKRNRFQEVEDNVSLFEGFKQWMEGFVKDTDLKGTTKANINKYYFAVSIRWQKDAKGNDVLTDTEKEELMGNARLAAEDLFSEFLATSLTYEDSVALDVIWNEKYNAFTSVIQFVDKVPIGFDGSTMFKNGELGVKPAQRQGLAYLQLTGSGCLAYDVGFGKTLTGILNVAQLMSQGAIKRPLIVVPKPTYKNWLKELFGYWTDGEKVEFTQFPGSVYHYGVFSGINVKVNDWYNLSGKHYQKLLAENKGDINKLVPENTITVVSYKGFEQMGFSRDISEDMFASIARVLQQKDVVEGQETQGSDKKKAKEQVTFYQKMQGLLGIGNKNAIVNVDTCGFDHMTIDEAHNFKNVFPSCGKDKATGRKLFAISASQSNRAVKMFFISNYIQAKHGKKVVLLTATPFTNSPLEIYSMLSFVGLETLNQYNLYNIKKFFEQFVLETIEYAIDSKGEIITKPVIKSFENLKLLQTILFNHFHYKDDPKEAGVVRPCKIDLPNKDITTYLEMNEWQINNQKLVKIMAKSVSRSNPGAGLKAMSMSLDNAFSPLLFAKEEPASAVEFVENSPKIKYAVECIRSVKEWHEARNEEPSGIVVYSNRGLMYFEYIRQYLIEELGYKSKVTYDDEVISEVEILSGGGGEADEDRKELIKDAFNAGVVKVIIGTGAIREGINLQSRSATLIDLYPEWNPTDVTQLKGRIWRQGNMYGYIRFVMPLVINSMDNFINQKLDEKSKRIANLWKPIGDLNKLDNTSDLDPAEIKYALVDDAGEKFKMKFETIKKDIQRELEILEENKYTMGEISSSIDDLKTAEEGLFDDTIEKKPQFNDYLEFLRKINVAKSKDKYADKTVKDIERVILNLTNLVESIGKYEANRYDIPQLFIVLRMIKDRNYDVFTDHSEAGKTLNNNISNIVDYQTFEVSSYRYDKLKSAYSEVRKAEKSVLTAYGKSWQDDLSEIAKQISKKIDGVMLSMEQIESPEYRDAMLNQINAEMEAAKSVRGDLAEQVNRFASLNHTLSYLSDNTDKEGCQIPTGPCCDHTGIEVVYTDKEHYAPISETPVSKSNNAETGATDEEIEIREAIDLITNMLPDLKGKDLKEAKEAVKLLSNMLPEKPKSEPQPPEEVYFINYLNKNKKHAKDVKEFKGKNAFEDAKKWGKKNIDNYNLEMINSRPAATLAKGGPAGEDQPDLFEDPDSLPSNARDILNKYSEDENDYESLAKMHSEMQAVGYTFEYGLDAVPYNLQKLGKGGPAGRSLSAINKDRKYYNSSQPHEVRYAKDHHRIKIRYHK